MSKEDRYTVIYDAGDWIVDTKTDEYLTIDEACYQLNKLYDDIMKLVGFHQHFLQLLAEANKE